MDNSELKKAQEDLTEAISLINKVRVELIHYYPDRSANIVYKTNCKIDHDRLFFAIQKLNRFDDKIKNILEKA